MDTNEVIKDLIDTLKAEVEGPLFSSELQIPLSVRILGPATALQKIVEADARQKVLAQKDSQERSTDSQEPMNPSTK